MYICPQSLSTIAAMQFLQISGPDTRYVAKQPWRGQRVYMDYENIAGFGYWHVYTDTEKLSGTIEATWTREKPAREPEWFYLPELQMYARFKEFLKADHNQLIVDDEYVLAITDDGHAKRIELKELLGERVDPIYDHEAIEMLEAFKTPVE